jgi:putative peptide zinc metalloprotease protein
MTFADGRTTSFRITGTRTTIGRGEDNVLVVRDGETSTHHAEIVASRERFRLRDVGSANGTTVNGQPVTDVDLRVGDEIGIGTVRLTFTQ